MIPNEISKKVTVDDVQFWGMFFFSEDDMLVISSRPDWIRNPIDNKKEYIKDMWIINQDIQCPQCQEYGKHGIITLESDVVVVCCVKCKQFVWTTLERR